MTKIPDAVFTIKRMEDKMDLLLANQLLLAEKVEKLMQTVDKIQLNSTKINSDVNDILGSFDKINNHVDFVDEIYETVKYPFHTAMNMITWSEVSTEGRSTEIEDDRCDERTIGMGFASLLLFGDDTTGE